MKLTKYPHAHLVLEEAGQKLIIDPGMFSSDLGDVSNVAAIVITHSHGDHLNLDNIKNIQAASPEVKIFGTPEVADQIPEATVVANGEEIEAGPFSLAFFGQEHAPIHPTVPVPHNIGVMVNDTLFYPGDSFTVPIQAVQVLAVPGNAPWAAVGEAMDYIAAVKPAMTFPTHDGLLSEAGHNVYNASLESICKESGTQFRFLKVGESLEI